MAVDNVDIRERWEEFYRRYYKNEIGKLAQGEKESLFVDFGDIEQYDNELADDVMLHPVEMLEAAEDALADFDIAADVSLDDAEVRISNFGYKTDIRQTRSDDVNKLIAVEGIVRKATEVRPKVLEAAFECQRCGTLNNVEQTRTEFSEPHQCRGCERKGPFTLLEDQSRFVDAQKLRVQESPEGLRGGQTPQKVDVNIEGDITGEVSPGDRVTATGVLRAKPDDGSTTFETFIEGNNVEIEDQDFEDFEITEEDEEAIREIASSPNLYDKILDSIAPSIYGYEMEKLAMVLQLFSGVTKSLPDGTRIRGDMHILLVGDPGTGKSQLLQYAQKISPRGIYTSGKGATSAGLCVAGDTKVHTGDGFREIRDIVERKISSPVEAETYADAEMDVYTYDGEDSAIRAEEASRLWRMPERDCREIETERGKTVEASTATPVLVCGDAGVEWKPIKDVEPGDYVAAPKYTSLGRSSLSPLEYIEFENERLRLSDASVELIISALSHEFGTLRAAADALELSEPFVYDTLRNRHVPYPKLRRVLNAVRHNETELGIESLTLRHGHEFRLPDEFDDDLMYLVGLVFGDGDISLSRRDENRGCIRVSNSDESVLREVVRIAEEKFGKEVEIERQEERVPYVRINSYTVAKLFDGVGMRTPKNDLALDERLTTAEHADAFLRGLYDADGSVSVRDNGGSCVHLCTVSEELAEQVQLMLETYGVYARRRKRDRRGTYELNDGTEIETTSIQHHIEVYGRDIDAFADKIGFSVPEKDDALRHVSGSDMRKGEKVPVGSLLASTDGGSSKHHRYVVEGSNPGHERARRILDDTELGGSEGAVSKAVEAPLRWERVVRTEYTGRKEVFDLTVPETHSFVANGVVTHNTAAAVQDDFGDGKWTLEAGALVLADKGIACVDEVDKMDQNDRSALHEALEQQQVSIAKAGINATLKSRCSLLGAANPKYGRFDEYEGIAEQIDLEPALISRFDLIFTVTDNPDEKEDSELAQHILQTNYAGEIAASGQDASDETHDIEPDINPELLRKYIAYSRRECNPTMTDEARDRIEEFYVDLRTQGGEGEAVPVTARKLEALVRLAEASARMRMSDKVEVSDADRAVKVTRASLDQVGRDPETGEFDIDVIESGTSQTQRDRIKGIKEIIKVVSEDTDDGKARLDDILELAEENGMSAGKVHDEIDTLKRKGEIMEPEQDAFRIV